MKLGDIHDSTISLADVAVAHKSMSNTLQLHIGHHVVNFSYKNTDMEDRLHKDLRTIDVHIRDRRDRS